MKKSAQKAPTRSPKLRAQAEEIAELRARLAEAEDTIDALRNGTVDAVVVSNGSSHKVFSLTGADQPYRVYVERMQEGAVTVSEDGTILFCNLHFAEMTGSPLEQVIGTNLTRYLSREAWQEIATVFIHTEVVKREALLRDADGTLLPVLLAASDLPLGSQTVICLVVTDLREQEENARLRLARDVAERANLAKDRFLAVLSHELRTPLTPVLMAVTALEEDADTPPALREELRGMKRNIELETRLIDDLLDLNSLSTGKLKLQKSAVDLNDVVRQVCEICQGPATEGQVMIEMKLDAGINPVTGDAARLQQVLWNLLKNAIKFTPSGGKIVVSTAVLPDGCCEATVLDTGIGIAADALPRIFEAFEQEHAGITGKYGGLGLGLAITKALVVLHGGQIDARSDGPGRGSCFTVRFPQGLAAGLTGGKPIEELTPRPGLRLLVVEDHRDTLAMLERLLTRRGYVVRTASSIAESLQVAREFAFDLLISDIGLPDGRGTDLLKSLVDQTERQVPSIAMSGYGMDTDIERSRIAGFSEHLTKPVDFTALQRAILRLADAQSF